MNSLTWFNERLRTYGAPQTVMRFRIGIIALRMERKPVNKVVTPTITHYDRLYADDPVPFYVNFDMNADYRTVGGAGAMIEHPIGQIEFDKLARFIRADGVTMQTRDVAASELIAAADKATAGTPFHVALSDLVVALAATMKLDSSTRSILSLPKRKAEALLGLTTQKLRLWTRGVPLDD